MDLKNMTEQSGYVYAFTMRIAGTDHKYTKIGFTTDPERRFREIERAIPGVLSVDFIIPGDQLREATLHQLFESVSLGNEWFWPIDLSLVTQLLATEIESMKKQFCDMNWWCNRHCIGHAKYVLEQTWGLTRERKHLIKVAQ